MAPEELHELARTKAQADGYCVFNGFDRAIPLYVQINTVFEQKLGSTHARTMDSLADLAQCLFQNFQYAESLEAWTKLLCVQATCGGFDKRPIRRMIKNCETALTLTKSTRDLGAHLQVMFSETFAHNARSDTLNVDPLLRVAQKVESRGKVEGARTLMKRWIKARADVAVPDDEGFIQDQRFFAKFLLSSGDLEQASSIYSSLVVLRNRQNTNGQFTDALIEALSDSEQCFAKMGRLVSMRATIELVNQIRQQREIEPNGPARG
jgi:hypothetical protein